MCTRKCATNDYILCHNNNERHETNLSILFFAHWPTDYEYIYFILWSCLVQGSSFCCTVLCCECCVLAECVCQLTLYNTDTDATFSDRIFFYLNAQFLVLPFCRMLIYTFLKRVYQLRSTQHTKYYITIKSISPSILADVASENMDHHLFIFLYIITIVVL